MDFGGSKKGSQDLLNALSPFFQPNSYDLLRKNCNSFSDCALWVLTGKRLPSQFTTMERMANRLGAAALMGNNYQKNEKADDFDLEKIIDKFDVGKMWATPGHSLGGAETGPLSAADLRAKRLEAMERREAEAKNRDEKQSEC